MGDGAQDQGGVEDAGHRGAAATVRAVVQLVRAPNALTAAADVLAGALGTHGLLVAAGIRDPGHAIDPLPLAALMLASFFLYAGGVALNDVVDADVDRTERPDRPIPRGLVTRGGAASLAVGCGLLGVLLAVIARPSLLLHAAALLALILAYDLGLKRTGVLGAVVLGGCRFLNMGLGAALVLGGLSDLVARPPLFIVAFGGYVTALGVIGLGEERGTPTGLFLLTTLAMIGCAVVAAIATPVPLYALIGLVLFVPPMIAKSLRLETPIVSPKVVRSRVRDGVLGIPGFGLAILLGTRSWIGAAVVVSLWIAARILARRISVA